MNESFVARCASEVRRNDHIYLNHLEYTVIHVSFAGLHTALGKVHIVATQQRTCEKIELLHNKSDMIHAYTPIETDLITQPDPVAPILNTPIFDLLLRRLDTLEGKLDLLNTKIESQQIAARRAASIRPLGEVMCGVALTGMNVELINHEAFDSRGAFQNPGNRDDIVIVAYLQDDMHTDHKPRLKKDPVSRRKFASILGVGSNEVAMSFCDIKTAVTTMAGMTLFDLAHAPAMHIFRVRKELIPLALACMDSSGEKHAWSALTQVSRARLMSRKDTPAFFTSQRLFPCFNPLLGFVDVDLCG